MTPIIHKITLFMVFIICATSVIAQNITISPDRPGAGDGVSTVPKGKFQIENGVTVAHETILNNFMLRFGITKSTEVRLGVDAGRSAGVDGLLPLTLSLKQRIIKQHKVIPAITFVGYISFPKMASKPFQSAIIPYSLLLAFSNTIGEYFSIDYTVGTESFETLTIIFGVGYAPTDRIGTFIEYFSSFIKGHQEHNIDVGITFLVNNNLQLDLSGGHSIFDSEHRLFGSLGISYLFKKTAK